ncbi:MAG: cytochrome c3 family protein [Colwellia sp.]|nr:cytochrome c3 family protein [Colwellia sp.]
MKKTTIIIGSLLLLTLLGITLYSSDITQSRLATPRYEAIIPMTFSHKSHKQQQCIDCHHNYVDNSGRSLLCMGCHLSKVELTYKLEDQFHELCMGCHRKKQLEGDKDYGPVRQCKACHTEERLP